MDLDYDGLPGAAEQALGTDPLIPDNPLAAATLALPSTVSGTVTVPLGLPASLADEMFIQLTVNGQPAPATLQGVNGDLVAEWDTTLLANSVYCVALEVQAQGGSGSVACPGKLVTVQNAICFPDGPLVAGDTLYVNAQTIYANGTWTMDIYDDQDNLFDSLAGDVDADGFCDYPDTSQQGVSISLLDEDGNPLPSEYYTVVVTTHAATLGGGAPSSASETKTYAHNKQRQAGPGQWVVAYQQLYSGDGAGTLDGILANVARIINTNPTYVNNTPGGSLPILGQPANFRLWSVGHIHR